MYSLAWCGWGGDEQESRLELVAALLEHPDVKDSINATRIHPVATPAPQGRGHSDGCRRDTVS